MAISHRKLTPINSMPMAQAALPTTFWAIGPWDRRLCPWNDINGCPHPVCAKTWRNHVTNYHRTDIGAGRNAAGGTQVRCPWCPLTSSTLTLDAFAIHAAAIHMLFGRPWRCTIPGCDQSFNRMDFLTQHLKQPHPEQGQEVSQNSKRQADDDRCDGPSKRARV